MQDSFFIRNENWLSVSKRINECFHCSEWPINQFCLNAVAVHIQVERASNLHILPGVRVQLVQSGLPFEFIVTWRLAVRNKELVRLWYGVKVDPTRDRPRISVELDAESVHQGFQAVIVYLNDVYCLCLCKTLVNCVHEIKGLWGDSEYFDITLKFHFKFQEIVGTIGWKLRLINLNHEGMHAQVCRQNNVCDQKRNCGLVRCKRNESSGWCQVCHKITNDIRIRKRFVCSNRISLTYSADSRHDCYHCGNRIRSCYDFRIFARILNCKRDYICAGDTFQICWKRQRVDSVISLRCTSDNDRTSVAGRIKSQKSRNRR